MSITRQSTRAYSTKEVEYEKLVKICEIARNAPSSCNSQPWKFHIVTNNSKDVDIKEVQKACQLANYNKFIEQVNSFIIIEQVPGNKSSRKGAFFTGNDFNSLDIGMVCDHICFAALDFGLGTCMIGAVKNFAMKKAMHFKINQRVRLVIAVGYPKEGTVIRKKSRKPTEGLIINH